MTLLAPIIIPDQPRSQRVTWDPLARQEIEADTLFLLDADLESGYASGAGGLIGGDQQFGDPATDALWLVTSKLQKTAGKYRTGLTTTTTTYGYAWMPGVGLLSTDQFTVEMWLRSKTGAWAAASDQTPWKIGLTTGNYVRFLISGGTLQAQYVVDQNNAATYTAALSYNLTTNPIAAGVWTNVALTRSVNGTLRMYVNGVQVDLAVGSTQARAFADIARGDGLSLVGAAGKGANEFDVSDVRHSRQARVPGVEIVVTNASSISIDRTAPTGATVQKKLLGGLHTLGNATTETLLGSGVMTVVRTDKLLTATPIKAGATDATHPTLGHSGSYSYDWQVVDRTLNYIVALGMEPYLSIDSTPQILGGSVAPFSGAALTTERSYTSGFAPQVPTDFAAFATIAGDLAYHATVELGISVPYWGVWNEPDGSFWLGTQTQYFQLYAAVAAALKAVNPAFKVGGPEVSHNDLSWFDGQIAYCQANGVPLDFVSWHPYSGDIGELQRVRAQVERQRAAVGFAGQLELICGEWTWQPAHLPKPAPDPSPFAVSNYFVNDWAGAFVAASLIEMQNAGVVRGVFTNPVADLPALQYAASGLVSSAARWAPGNAFDLFSRLKATILTSTATVDPGIFHVASKDGAGVVTVLIANLHYRTSGGDQQVVVSVPDLGTAVATLKVVDVTRSNQYDAGLSHAAVESAPANYTQGRVRLALKPRSVALLTITPS